MKTPLLLACVLYVTTHHAFSQTPAWENAGLPYVNPPSQSHVVNDLYVFKGRLLVCGEINLYYTDDGTTWTAATGLPLTNNKSFTKHITHRNDTLILSTYNRYYFSVDTGATWSEIPNSYLPHVAQGLYTFGQLTLRANAYYRPYLQYSFDGQTWDTCQINVTFANPDMNMFFKKHIVQYKGALFGLANLKSPSISTRQIYTSTDNGITWNEVTTSGMSSSGTWVSMSVFKDTLYVAAGSSQKLYKSTDGVNFQQVNVNLPLYEFSFIKALSNNLFYGATSVPALSADGVNWTAYPSNAQATPVNQGTTDAVVFNNYLYIGNPFGLFRLNLANISAISEKEQLHFSVYPNPTSGRFVIESEKPGTFQLLDISGKIIREYQVINQPLLVQENLPAGIYWIRALQPGRSVKLVLTE